MSGPFAELALSYWARGFSPLSILADTKRPGAAGHDLRHWAQYCVDAADKAQLAAWASDKAAGLAVCTGFNGLIAIDVDDIRANAAVRAVLGGLGAPVKIGRRGCTAFFRDTSGKIVSRDWRASPKETLLQVLATGRQTVLPPTVHPETGKPYFWHSGNLEDCRIGDLPVITPGHIEALSEELRPLMPVSEPLSPAPPRQAALRNLTDLERKRYAGMARALLRHVAETLPNRAPGGRSRAVYGYARNFAPFVAAGLIGPEEVRAVLMNASEKNRLVKQNGRADVLHSIRNGFADSAADSLPELESSKAKCA